MPRTPKRFVGPKAMVASDTVEYTVPASTKAVVRHIHFSNTSAGAVTVTLQIDDNAGGALAGERIFDAYPLAASATLDHYCSYPIDATGVIRAQASSTAVTLTVTGDEYTVG